MELKRGDLEQGFASADVIVERESRTPTSHQGYIEPHACVARVNEDGRISIWTSTQGPFLVRDATALMLGIDAANIKVTPSEIGGGFGGKIPVYLEPLAVVLARQTQRPVKMVMTRDEVFRASGPTSATRSREDGGDEGWDNRGRVRVALLRSRSLPRFAVGRRGDVRVPGSTISSSKPTTSSSTSRRWRPTGRQARRWRHLPRSRCRRGIARALGIDQVDIR